MSVRNLTARADRLWRNRPPDPADCDGRPTCLIVGAVGDERPADPARCPQWGAVHVLAIDEEIVVAVPAPSPEA